MYLRVAIILNLASRRAGLLTMEPLEPQRDDELHAKVYFHTLSVSSAFLCYKQLKKN